MTLVGPTRSAAKVLSQPLVQFLVLGLAFFAAYTWMHEPVSEASEKVIRVSSADVSRLDAAWRAQWGRAPTGEELTGLVRNHVREVALYRHAVEMGLDQGDPLVRRVLGQRLQTMIQGLVELSLSPTDEDLRSYFDAHPDRYRSADRITFTHLFVDPDRREKKTLDDAKTILARLRGLENPTQGIEELGDPFMLQRYYPGKSRLEIEKLFGRGFAGSVFELSPETWHGPVLSGYGVHLVYVHALEPGAPLEFEAIRDRVQQDWLDVRRKEVQDEYLSDVLSSYEVVLEGGETD